MDVLGRPCPAGEYLDPTVHVAAVALALALDDDGSLSVEGDEAVIVGDGGG
ncbi:hypothetical protein [Halorubrum halophilum]|uniref:hypothetical protein n=1 Tax=Halorubrum halophilum TaxID=413816 RepID=UPI000B0E1E11|nr:hypothetical protein [Halorubrum halophilum]